MTRNSKKNSMTDLVRRELRESFTYKSRRDLEFVSALMRYLNKIFPHKATYENTNITFWWTQKIFCVTNANIEKGDDMWYPDALKRKLIIETYEIKGETKEEWKSRKKKLMEYYAPVIAIYHETIFSCFIKRIHPVLADKIYEQFQETKEDKIRP